MSNEIIDRTRRNHALEHATIHILSEHHKGFSAQGNSTPKGFNLNIYGSITEDEVSEAVEEAFQRLHAGEERLAVHPNCGTVLLTMASLASLSAVATFGLEQRRQKRSNINLAVLLGALPSTILAVTIALIAARPIGIALQDRFTVDSELADLRVTSIRRVRPSLVTRVFQLLLGQARSNEVNAYRIDTVS
jgi:hypothetical protein